MNIQELVPGCSKMWDISYNCMTQNNIATIHFMSSFTVSTHERLLNSMNGDIIRTKMVAALEESIAGLQKELDAIDGRSDQVDLPVVVEKKPE